MDILEHRNFSSPDEVMEFEKGKIEILNMKGGTLARLSLEPGWHWAEHEKPLVNTELCEVPHFFYLISGRIRILMADGTEFECGAGEVLQIPAGHDAWVIGDETVVGIDWSGAIH